MIGIIGAMEEEVAALKEAMTIEENVTFASMDFCKGTLCGKAVVVVRSGIGKVNAAICTQILVDKFGVDTLMECRCPPCICILLPYGAQSPFRPAYDWPRRQDRRWCSAACRQDRISQLDTKESAL